MMASKTDEVEKKAAFELLDVMKNDRASALPEEVVLPVEVALPKEDLALWKELCSFFGHDRTKGNEIEEVFRANEIIEELSMNVNFASLPYGETFLSSSVGHSLEMMQMLVEKGADVNLENEVAGETALDVLLELEDYRQLSDEEKEMKKFLLSMGAKTAEERFYEIAELARNKHRSAWVGIQRMSNAYH